MAVDIFFKPLKIEINWSIKFTNLHDITMFQWKNQESIDTIEINSLAKSVE